MDASLFRYLLSLPFTPLPFFWLLIIISALCYRLKKLRSARRIWWSALAWLLLISTSPVPNVLVASLENQYQPLIVPPQSLNGGVNTYILVLGAGHANNPMLPATGQLSNSELGRLIEGVRLQKQLSQSVLVSSGVKGKNNTESQATTVRKAAIELGVPPQLTDTLSFTINTMAEAQHFKKRFSSESRLILVTDAVHMPRAMKWFQKVGLKPIPAPTNFILKHPPNKRPIGLIPGSSNIKTMEQVVHEYLGLVWMSFWY